MTTAKKNEVIKEEIVEVAQTVQPKKRVKIDRATEVMIMNNTNGKFVYENDKTHTSCLLSEYGDVDYMTVNELLTMKNSHRDIIEKFWIRIVDVENEEVEIGDVLKFLLIEDLYKSVLNTEEVAEMLLKYDDSKFEKAFKNLNKEFKNRIIERSILLYQSKEFNDFYKMGLIQDYLGNGDFYKEITERDMDKK